MNKTIFFLLLAICTNVSASTYYVATNGNDSNPGTYSKPWLTWDKAFNSAEVNPGDTVFFRGGVYYHTEINGGYGYECTRDGTEGNYIQYFNYPGEKPILDCKNIVPTGTTLNIPLYTGYMNYIHFKGLIIRNVKQNDGEDEVIAWFINGENLIIEECIVHDTHGIGFKANVCDETYFINCDSYNNCDSLTTVPESNPSPGNDGCGFLDFNWHTTESSVYFKGCRAWNCGDQGFSSGSIGYTEYDNCLSFKNGQLEGGGHGFKIGWIQEIDSAPLNRLYKNCVAAYNRHTGFTTNDYGYYCGAMHLYNNTSYRNGHDPNYNYNAYGFYIDNTLDADSRELLRVLRNNIAFDNENGDVRIGSNAEYAHDHNNWDIPLSITASDFESLDSTGISGPRKPDGSLPDLRGFLTLSSSSKAVNAGIDLGLPYDGDAPDLGASTNHSNLSINIPPSITITNPTSGSEFVATTDINILTNASDTDGSIAKVEFFHGNVKLGEKTSAPWSFAWTNSSEGNYSIKAVATDNSDGKTTSSAIAVTVLKPAPVNQPPLISVLSPSMDQSFSEGDSITIITDASDPDGLIAKVEFFRGNVKLGEKTSAPWSFAWTNTSEGNYSIKAVATDNSDGKTSSSAIAVTVLKPAPVNQPPLISVLSPSMDQSFSEGDSITIVTDASDPDGSIAKVEFFNGNTKLGERTSTPWSYSWNNASAGNHSIMAVATDNSDVKTSSSAIAVSVLKPAPVNQPPLISVLSPSMDQSFSEGDSITIVTDASDPDGSIAKVEFFLGNVKLGEKTSAPWSYTWNNASVGNHSIKAVATDNSDGKTTSTAVQITVNTTPPIINQPPIITIVNPSTGDIFAENESVFINVNASDPDGTLTKVEFFNGDTKLGESTSSPWLYTLNNTIEGNYSLTAIATDNYNSKTISQVVSITIQNPPPIVNQSPIVSLVSPYPGQSYSDDEDITLQAATTDLDGSIIKVEFFSGKLKLGEKTSIPWTFSWKNVSKGTYSVTAVATDNLNTSSTSSQVWINVDSQTFFDVNSDILNLYPNPNNGLFSISHRGLLRDQNHKIIITTIDGKIIYDGVFQQEEFNKSIDISSSKPGAYILKFVGIDEIITKKIIIQ